MARLIVAIGALLLAGCPTGNGQADRPTAEPAPTCKAVVDQVTELYDRARIVNGARAQTLAELAGQCSGGLLSRRQIECIGAATSLEGLALCDGFRLKPVAPGEM